jgi:hypothetical protein
MIIQQINGTNGTVYQDLASALYDIGHIILIQVLWLTIYIPVSIVGILGNIFCVYIFYQPAFYSPTSPPLFSYMRYESIIGIVGNLVGAVYGFNLCSDILPFVNTYFSESVIQPNLAIPLYNMSYYTKFLIEIAIVVDRILMLTPSIMSVNWLKIKRPYLVLIAICTFSLLINWPYLYLIDTAKVNIFISYPDQQMYTFYAANVKTDWSTYPRFGYFVMLFIFVFKHVVTFIIETVLSVVSLVLFQRHLAHKVKLTRTSTVTRARLNEQMLTTAGPASSNEQETGGRKMANLVFVMSITGFVHNAIMLTYTVFNLTSKANTFLRVLGFVAYFSSTVRHSVNFVQFYCFNTAFRTETRVVLNKMRLSRVQRVNLMSSGTVVPVMNRRRTSLVTVV